VCVCGRVCGRACVFVCTCVRMYVNVCEQVGARCACREGAETLLHVLVNVLLARAPP